MQQTTCRGGLFYYFVGAGKDCRGNCEADNLGGLEIDNEFVLDRRLHRQIGGLLALEDAIDVNSGTSKWVNPIGPI